MENRINIGELDTLVTIQKVTKAIGTQGENVTVFTDHSRVYAKVDRDVAESVNDMNYEAGQTVLLTIYKIPALTSRWRVIIGDTPYEIRNIDPISRISPLYTLTLGSIE